MLSAASKLSLATIAAGAALVGAPAMASAMPATEPGPPPPSSIAAPAARDYAQLRDPHHWALVNKPHQDLRMPDTRDAANGYKPVLHKTSAAVATTSAAAADNGFDVLSAGIGAAAGSGLVLVLVAGGGVLRRRTTGQPVGA
jgi:hypothetical protein